MYPFDIILILALGGWCVLAFSRKQGVNAA